MEHEHETPELDQEFDPVFEEEQQHLTETYAKLQTMGRDLLAKMEANSKDAAADKLAMVDELSVNLASYADAMETYADFATVNRVIDAYNLAQTVDAEKLTSIQVLLKQPYFAKVVLQMKPGQEPKELYIGTAGIADETGSLAVGKRADVLLVREIACGDTGERTMPVVTRAFVGGHSVFRSHYPDQPRGYGRDTEQLVSLDQLTRPLAKAV